MRGQGRPSERAAKTRREETDAGCVRGCLLDVAMGRAGLRRCLIRAAVKAVDRLSPRRGKSGWWFSCAGVQVARSRREARGRSLRVPVQLVSRCLHLAKDIRRRADTVIEALTDDSQKSFRGVLRSPCAGAAPTIARGCAASSNHSDVTGAILDHRSLGQRAVQAAKIQIKICRMVHKDGPHVQRCDCRVRLEMASSNFFYVPAKPRQYRI